MGCSKRKHLPFQRAFQARKTALITLAAASTQEAVRSAAQRHRICAWDKAIARLPIVSGINGGG